MNQNCPISRLSVKSPASNSFALKSFYPFLSIKEITSQSLTISLSSIVGKGPPGSARSPGEVPMSSINHSLTQISTTMKINSIKHIKKQQSITIKIQTPMKKQILFFALFVIVLLAGTSTSFGQLGPGVNTATPLTCEPQPLHPRAGVNYIYSVGADGDGAPATYYTWWVTKNPSFISTDVTTHATTTNLDTRLTTPAGLVVTSDNYGIRTAATEANSNQVQITWTPETLAGTSYQDLTDPGTPTYVVALVESECTNNIQVYEINPMPAFTLDIANINPATTDVLPIGEATEQCVDQVRGATYAGGELTMNYGTNTLYYEVLAANFVTSWRPTFTLTAGLSGNQTATIGWASSLANAQAGTFIEEMPITVGTAITGTEALTTTETNTANGVALYVRVVITNNDYESTGNQPFILAVDGQDASLQWDLDQADATCALPTGADRTDIITHTINARPNVTDATNDNLNDPDTFIPKTVN